MRKIWGVMTCFFSLKISRGVHISKALTAGSVHSIEVEIEARGLSCLDNYNPGLGRNVHTIAGGWV